MPIDTLSIAKRMTQVGYTPEQAELQAVIFQEIVESELATKRDIKELETGLKRDIKELETGLKRDIKELELKFERWQSDNHRLMWQMSVGAVVLFTTIVGFLLRFTGKG